jgi:hypothetical protein
MVLALVKSWCWCMLLWPHVPCILMCVLCCKDKGKALGYNRV